MSSFVPLIQDAVGCYQDDGRDSVPAGFVWDMLDLFPGYGGAPMSERNAWIFQHNDALPNIPNGGVYAPFINGHVLVVVNSTNIRLIDVLFGGVSTSFGPAIPVHSQNPLFWRDRVILPGDGNNPAQIITQLSPSTFGLLSAGVGAGKGKYACIYKDRLWVGGPASPIGTENQVAASKPGDATLAWDALSVFNTSLPVKGLASMRNQILVFHQGSIESLIGTTPPDSTLSDPTGDMRLAPLYDKAGCVDARSIVNWNQYVIFADARGIYITDGADVKSITVQAGMETAWRRDFASGIGTLAAAIYKNLYIISIRTAGTPITYAVELDNRRMYRLSNINASCMFSFSGVGETLYGSDATAKKITDLSAMFRTVTGVGTIVDANSGGPQAMVESGWTRVGATSSRRRSAGERFRRIYEVFLSYDCTQAAGVDVLQLSYLHSPTDTSYENFGTVKHAVEYVRRKIGFGRRLMGIAIRVQAIGAGQRAALRIYDLSVTVNEEDPRKLG